MIRVVRMKLNETDDNQDDQWDRLAEVWPRLSPAVRRSILALVEGSARLQQLNNRARGGVRPPRMSNLLLEN